MLSVHLLNTVNTYVAGDKIHLNFKVDGDSFPTLWLKNAFGTSIITATQEENHIQFKLPLAYSQKAGICHWALIFNNTKVASGKIHLEPNIKSPAHLESYFGPRSITAGDIDYSMLVCIPTDAYDNPLSQGTPIIIKHQFEDTITRTPTNTRNLIAWKNVPATNKSGRILVSSSYDKTHSKELTTIVFPATASDFEIDQERVHSYADGNQIINFKTSIIRDRFNNIVSDGTLVSFITKDDTGALLQAFGNTINGVAKAQMLHPNEKSSWETTAYITGAARSNTLPLDFKAAVTDFELSFSQDQRTITIGPMNSFMDQLVPDGIGILLKITGTDGEVVETMTTTSRNGLGVFKLSRNLFKKDTYQIEVRAAGITKKQTHTIYE